MNGFGSRPIDGSSLAPPPVTPTPNLAPQPGTPTPGWTPGSTFTAPQASGSAWTGVSSNADPYGIHGVGYDISQIPTQLDNKGMQTNTLSRDELLRAGGYGHDTSFLKGDLPDSMKFSGYSKYENQNAADGSALGSDASRIQAQTQNAQNNLNTMSSAYPAYGNQYGLGGQLSPPASTNLAQGDYSGQGVTANVPDNSSRGFNPWSIQGESNARDTSKGVSI